MYVSAAQAQAPDVAVPPPPGLAAAAGVPPIAVPVIALPVVVPPLAVPLGAPGSDHGPQSGPWSGPVQPSIKMRTGSPPPAAVGLDAAMPVAFRAGYADYLRTANTMELAAVALPGVTGMMALTGLGGFVGYRQAKAGRTVRIDASRFMS
ncbi:hypothetical protein A5792_19035 [Mycolicibacterium peregrinum]|uniref:Uncharacterized protein n=1 Tax=Mycolicibacterium peregrinum TaxID=43304 RepID=A0A1A0R9S2_MYCPR|nr:hypothetical protein A5792_19035 [Mycolicibacterium peregrinum]